MEPSCLLGLGNPHLLIEHCVEGLNLIKAPHAEMGNLLSLNPKIHHFYGGGRADRNLAAGPKRRSQFEDSHRLSIRAAGFGEVACVHAYLYGISSTQNKSRFAQAQLKNKLA